MSVWNRVAAFDDVAPAHRISLGEGETPLVRSRRIGPRAGLPNLWLKLESSNPTGSYKDRFAAAAVSHLCGDGARRCLSTSSGNAGSALAAYCAVAGIPIRLVIVEDAPLSKLRQMQAYGADLVRVRGFGTDPTITEAVLRHLGELASEPGNALLVSSFRYSPLGMGAVRTIAWELVEQLVAEGATAETMGEVVCPAGAGGLTLAVAQGLAGSPLPEARRAKVVCAQPRGNDTIATPLREGASAARAVASTTQISGLQVGAVLDGDATIAAVRATGGTGQTVSDKETWDAQAALARDEGVFCEPAGAVPVAALLARASAGELDAGQHHVCIVSGSGFKDGASLERMVAGVECPLLDLDQWRLAS